MTYQLIYSTMFDMSISPLLVAYKSMKREITLIASTELKRLGVGEKQMAILFVLAENQETTASLLADRTQSDPAAVTRALQSMEEAGLLKRKPDNQDNRRTLVCLTAKGREKAAEMEVVREEILARISKTLKVRDLRELERLMQTVAAGLLAQRGAT